MYKNFRVGGGIVLGLSALVLGLVGCSTATFRNSDNNIKKAENLVVDGTTYNLVSSVEELVEGKDYIFGCNVSGTDKFITGTGTSLSSKECSSESDYNSLTKFNFKKVDNKFNIIVGSTYLGCKTSNALDSATTGTNSKFQWEISQRDDGTFSIKSNDGTNDRYLVLNFNSKTNKVAPYKTSALNAPDATYYYFNIYASYIDEINPALNLKTTTDVTFDYKYLSESSGQTLTGISKNGAKEGQEEAANGGVFKYNLGSNYADSNPYVNKMDDSGRYIEYTFANPVDNASIKFSYKVFGSINARFDVYCYADENDSSQIGNPYPSEKLSGANNAVVKDFTIEIPDNYKNIKRIKLSYVKTSANVGVGQVTFTGIETTKINGFTNVSNVKLNIGFKDIYVDEYETGILVTAKENFTIADNLVPSEYPYIHVTNNTKKVEDFYVSVLISDAKKYLNTEIFYTPIVVKDGLTYFGELKSTTLKAEISKIGNSTIKDFVLSYLGA